MKAIADLALIRDCSLLSSTTAVFYTCRLSLKITGHCLTGKTQLPPLTVFLSSDLSSPVISSVWCFYLNSCSYAGLNAAFSCSSRNLQSMKEWSALPVSANSSHTSWRLPVTLFILVYSGNKWRKHSALAVFCLMPIKCLLKFGVYLSAKVCSSNQNPVEIKTQ